MVDLDKIFSSFVNNSLFSNKSFLQSNYTPENIPHRDDQIESIASILAPTLRGERASNLFIYGKTGSGKSLSVQHVTIKISEKAKELLAKEGFDPNLGARPLKRVIQRLILDPLSVKIVIGEIMAGSRVLIDASKGKITFETPKLISKIASQEKVSSKK